VEPGGIALAGATKDFDLRRDLPDDVPARLMWRRTLMANERTYSSWLRTVLSLVAVALALPKLITGGSHDWIVKVIGVVFIIVAGTIFIFASITYSDTDRRLIEEGLVTAPRWFFWAMTAGIMLCILLSLLLVI
jgi:uncharacterized membrane protein YidH (DUF202 family)